MDSQDEQDAELIRLLTRSRNISEARAAEIIAEAKVDGKKLTRSKAVWGMVGSVLAVLLTGGLVALQWSAGRVWIWFTILLMTAFVMALAALFRFSLQLRGILTKQEVPETLLPR